MNPLMKELEAICKSEGTDFGLFLKKLGVKDHEPKK